jgi:hypothetical protein
MNGVTDVYLEAVKIQWVQITIFGADFPVKATHDACIFPLLLC